MIDQITVYKDPRKIIQLIKPTDEDIDNWRALCNDGTVWEWGLLPQRDAFGWTQSTRFEIPQDD